MALDNCATVLGGLGGTLDDIVAMTVHFVRFEDRDAITRARAERLNKAHGPVSTGVQVASLWHPDLLVEITPIAVIPFDRFRAPAA